MSILSSGVRSAIVELKADDTQHGEVWISNLSTISTFDTEEDDSAINPQSIFPKSRGVLENNSELYYGFAQSGEQYMLVTNKEEGCLLNSSVTSKVIVGVVAGVCGETVHIDGNLKTARFSEPNRIVSSPTSDQSYLILDISRIISIDFRNDQVTTLHNIYNTTIADIAINVRGVVFAVVI